MRSTVQYCQPGGGAKQVNSTRAAEGPRPVLESSDPACLTRFPLLHHTWFTMISSSTVYKVYGAKSKIAFHRQVDSTLCALLKAFAHRFFLGIIWFLAWNICRPDVGAFPFIHTSRRGHAWHKTWRLTRHFYPCFHYRKKTVNLKRSTIIRVDFFFFFPPPSRVN